MIRDGRSRKLLFGAGAALQHLLASSAKLAFMARHAQNGLVTCFGMETRTSSSKPTYLVPSAAEAMYKSTLLLSTTEVPVSTNTGYGENESEA